MYEAVFLDAGNTLFHTPVPRRERIARALERRSRRVEPAELEAVMKQVRDEMWDSPLWPLETREREEKYWLEYYGRLLDHLDEDVDVAGELAKEALYVHYVRAFADGEDVLGALRGQVKLGVISNAFPSLSEALDNLALTSYFDEVVNSSLVDSWKPDTRIYRIALDRLSVSPEHSVFVDDLEENVATAEDLGFTAILIDRWDQMEDTEHQRITDLRPVVELVTNS